MIPICLAALLSNGLCFTWSETLTTGLLVTRLMWAALLEKSLLDRQPFTSDTNQAAQPQ